jgi:hypothetical protein
MPRLFVSALAATTTLVAASAAQAAPRCEDMTRLSTATRTVTAAVVVPAGDIASPFGPVSGVPSLCKVTGFISPVPTSRIGFEVWLPLEGWNGRLQQVGNGGLAGVINPGPLAQAVKGGYAAAATDDGHTASPIDGSWALNRPDRIEDFAHRAVHETALTAKDVVRGFYGRPQDYAYFNGCSEGGREAMIAAQRYPDDFDGILAGAPALYWSRLMLNFMWNAQALHGDPMAYVAAGKLPALQAAALKQCDALDGLSDGIVSAPQSCRFDPGVLLCKAGETDQCLTAPQIAAVRRVYAGPGPALSAGYMPGAEAVGGMFGWPGYVTGPARTGSLQVMFSTGYYANFVFGDPAWSFDKFDFNRDPARARTMARLMDADDADLSRFKARGGKLIQYHGWADPSPTPLHSVQYHDAVRAKMGAKADSFYRLYMAPGMLHCGMGPGPNAFGNALDPAPSRSPDSDVFEALRAWVEKGKAPRAILATKYVDDDPAKGAAMTRPLCPYPQVATWSGKGRWQDAANFRCEAPKRS